MNCFNHSDHAAVGICKSCGKALCRDRMTEMPHGLACKGACEPRVQLMNRIIDNNARILSVARAQTKMAVGFASCWVVSSFAWLGGFTGRNRICWRRLYSRCPGLYSLPTGS